MKKLIFLLTAFILAAYVSAAEVANGQCGDNVTWSLSDDGVLTISGSGDMWDARDMYFDSHWCTNNSYGEYYASIKSVVIKDGVKSIGGAAFYGCSSLSSITIPSSVTSIRSSAFCECI